MYSFHIITPSTALPLLLHFAAPFYPPFAHNLYARYGLPWRISSIIGFNTVSAKEAMMEARRKLLAAETTSAYYDEDLEDDEEESGASVQEQRPTPVLIRPISAWLMGAAGRIRCACSLTSRASVPRSWR
jgi:hypothetical protein